MSNDQREERELVLRDAVVAGQTWAWAELYEASYETLWGYVFWRSGRVSEWTEEVVQQTWLVAVGKIRRFDARQGSFIGWLRGIADNVLRARLRRWIREEQARSRAADRRTVGPADEQAQLREQALGVARALAALPADYEKALRAKYLDERRVAEIAGEEGVPPKTIESRLTRARAAFREAYLRFVDPEMQSADGASRRRSTTELRDE